MAVCLHGYATKFLPLGGHEHMFWVFESAQKMKLLAFILLFSSHCEGSLESVYRKQAVLFMPTSFFQGSCDSNLVEAAVKTPQEKTSTRHIKCDLLKINGL